VGHERDKKSRRWAPAFRVTVFIYRRLRAPFLAAARAAFFLARVRAPFRAEALRWALVLRPPLLFFAADLRPRFLAAAIFVSPR
jgi:hypothetical protein